MRTLDEIKKSAEDIKLIISEHFLTEEEQKNYRAGYNKRGSGRNMAKKKARRRVDHIFNDIIAAAIKIKKSAPLKVMNSQESASTNSQNSSGCSQDSSFSGVNSANSDSDPDSNDGVDEESVHSEETLDCESDGRVTRSKTKKKIALQQSGKATAKKSDQIILGERNNLPIFTYFYNSDDSDDEEEVILAFRSYNSFENKLCLQDLVTNDEKIEVGNEEGEAEWDPEIEEARSNEGKHKVELASDVQQITTGEEGEKAVAIIEEAPVRLLENLLKIRVYYFLVSYLLLISTKLFSLSAT